MSDAFISYSRTDSAFADKLLHDLEARGIPVWIDRDNIEGGAAWRAAISMAIRSCCAFILILSPRSTESEQVSKELSVAETHNRRIIPVVIENCVIPPGMELQLAELQWISFAEHRYEAALERLTRVIKEARSQTAEEASASNVPAPSGLRSGTGWSTPDVTQRGSPEISGEAPSAASSGSSRKWLFAGAAMIVAVASVATFRHIQGSGSSGANENAARVDDKAPRTETAVATGPGSKGSVVPAVAQTSRDAPRAERMKAESAPAPAQASVAVVGNSRTLLYHFPECPGYSRISTQARIEFSNAREAERAGYKLSDNCADPSGSRPAAGVIANSRTRDYFLPHCNGYAATRPEYRIPFNSATEAEQAGYRRGDKCS